MLSAERISGSRDTPAGENAPKQGQQPTGSRQRQLRNGSVLCQRGSVGIIAPDRQGTMAVESTD